MPYIVIKRAKRPGIGGLLAFRPVFAGPLMDLAEALLRGENTLSRGERELIAAYVSTLNDCQWSARVHGAFAAAQLDGGHELVTQACQDPEMTDLSPKFKALLRLVAAVVRSGKAVGPELVESARELGASDEEIHDTVLITATFCMFNRYVSGLGTVVPDDPEIYRRLAEIMIAQGYRALSGIQF